MTNLQKIGAAIVLAAGLALAAMPNVEAGSEPRPRVPRCAEDEIVRGYGDFRDGLWDRYACENVGDFVSGAIENNYRWGDITGAVVGTVCEHPRYWKYQGIGPLVEETCH